MKKITLFFFGIIISINSFSQAVFEIISNTCDTNILGTIYSTIATSLNSWNTPDMNDPANSIQGCLVFYNDGANSDSVGTPPTTINYAFGCDSNYSTFQDLSGKIAVIYRGWCEFGIKVYNAQQRGAIGVVIINHTDSAVGMSGGTYGLWDTIPVIQISRMDGDILTPCIDTVCNGVVGFIGKPNPTEINRTKIYEKLYPYPNPTINLLIVPIRKSVMGDVLVEVFDLAGKLVLSENKTIGNEPLKVNVASIQNGVYVFKLTFSDGTQDKFKISVNR